VFYLPRKIREAQFRELTKQHKDEQEKARKAERKENRAAAARYRKQIAKEAKAAREVAKKKKQPGLKNNRKEMLQPHKKLSYCHKRPYLHPSQRLSQSKS
jgi:hypothetical protein